MADSLARTPPKNPALVQGYKDTSLTFEVKRFCELWLHRILGSLQPLAPFKQHQKYAVWHMRFSAIRAKL
jgi:hypothetical protein